MNSLMLQKRHGLHAIGGHVQMHGRIGVVKRFLRQPHRRRDCLRPKSTLSIGIPFPPEDLHDLHEFLIFKNIPGRILCRAFAIFW